MSTSFFCPIWIQKQLLFHIPYFLWAFTISSLLYFSFMVLIYFTLLNRAWLILRSQEMTNLFFTIYLLVRLWFSQSFTIIFECFNHFNFVLIFDLKLFTLNRWIECFLLNIMILLFISVAFNIIYVVLRRKLIFNIYITGSIYGMRSALLKFSFLDTCKIHIDLITAIFLASELIFLCYYCIVIAWLELHVFNVWNLTVFLKRVLNHLCFLRLW